MTNLPGRRGFLKSSALALASAYGASKLRGVPLLAATPATNERLPDWEPGILEIHHIDTGRGNSTLILEPDGSSLLIDAGDAHSAAQTMSPARPDASRRAGEWIARYAQRQLARIHSPALDIMLLTHFHGDHVGELSPTSPQSKHGSYSITGAAEVAESIPVRAIVDRGWPDYTCPSPLKDPSALNYVAFAQSMATRNVRVERATAGSINQLSLHRNRAQFPDFSARVLSVNGYVWTGQGESASPRFPTLSGLGVEELPTENMCSIAIMLRYGPFRYFTGGDLTCDTSYGRYPWHDIETPVAEAAGPVTIAVADHHGYFDACGPAAVRALRPKCWVLPTWHVSHPAMNVMANLYSEDLYAGERTVFATGMTNAALLSTERFSRLLKSTEGHVVVRVPAGGQKFTVFVLDSQDEAGTVKSVFGPIAV